MAAATSGVECLAALGRHPLPDLLLLDLKLPLVDGFEVLRTMRARALDVPTIAMTGHPLEFSAEDSDALGAVEYLIKPIFIDDLMPLVRRRVGLEPDPMVDVHAGVVAGEERAISRAAATLLIGARRRLRSRFPHADPQRVDEAIEDAILDYVRNPQRFDPAVGRSLAAFVYANAWRNLANTAHAEYRRKQREIRYARVQPTAALESARYSQDELRHARHIIRQHLARERDAVMRAALLAWLEGDHTTAPFRTVSSFAQLGAHELAREVKRRKDAFWKAVLRGRARSS